VITRVKQDGTRCEVRPQFEHHAPSTGTWWSCDQVTSELAEDSRNLLEGIQGLLRSIRDSQMLQCDVRDDVHRMRIALEKIAKNMPRRRRRGGAK